jgi:hypothetical protein
MSGFNFSNIVDYQRRLDILANLQPFRPGMFLVANDEKLLREIFDDQIELSEMELERWASRYPEDGPQKLRCKIVDKNPLKIKILQYDVDREQEVIRDNWEKKAEWRRKRQREWRSQA